jgi:signal transduction histidine kinase
LIRFNEAIDQAIAESITTYSRDVRESKDRFLAILGHDLRTPLGAIITSTRFMLDTGTLEEPHFSLVSGTEKSARRMNRLVGDLLEFTRTRFGDEMPVVVDAMDACQMVHDVAAEVRASYPASAVNVRCEGDVRGRWDNERLTQAMINLVSNAVQHGAKDSPVDIEVTGTSEGVTISVRNEGQPIPDSQMMTLFNGMKQVRPPAQRDRRHFGLGLYIVDKIVRAHRGTINVQSSADHTTFAVWLPHS